MTTRTAQQAHIWAHQCNLFSHANTLHDAHATFIPNESKALTLMFQHETQCTKMIALLTATEDDTMTEV